MSGKQHKCNAQATHIPATTTAQNVDTTRIYANKHVAQHDFTRCLETFTQIRRANSVVWKHFEKINLQASVVWKHFVSSSCKYLPFGNILSKATCKRPLFVNTCHFRWDDIHRRQIFTVNTINFI